MTRQFLIFPETYLFQLTVELKNFENTFAKGGVPENVLEVSVAEGTPLVDILIAQQIVISKSEWRRLVAEGAITNMEIGQRVTDLEAKVSSGVYKIGKRRFIKIKVL